MHTKKTFLQALINNVCDIPLRQLPRVCVKWDRITITILEEEYLPRFETCRYKGAFVESRYLACQTFGFVQIIGKMLTYFPW